MFDICRAHSVRKGGVFADAYCYSALHYVFSSNRISDIQPESYIIVAFELITLKGKGKAIPLQALTGPEGSKRLRIPDFKTIDT
jgi:hypothetical protein